ncbi:DUF262 domain-containing protein [Niallia taxi]|uniref:DUF262 domain-containing protein n=1 Tax=Niallia taxi TaxID=2499688 RepID=UPI002E1B6FF6|nr:DUF262 domain-containing protein [Niallia taxi]
MSTAVANKYTSTQFTFEQLKGRVTVPPFQRRLVWSKQQKKEFIETLSKGFPFGSVLIYKYEEDTMVSLIDGLQRFSTIMDYEKNPQEYIDITEEIDLLVSVLTANYPGDLTAKILNSIKKDIKGLIKDIISKQNVEPMLLFDTMNRHEELSQYLDSTQLRETVHIQHQITSKKSNYLKVNEIIIPTVEFLGDVSELSEVFENLNKGGKKLSKYQVFAAQWYRNTITLNDMKNNKNILEEIIKRYELLDRQREIKIEDFSPEKMREEKVINLSELCYALGKLIIKESSVFFNHKKEDGLEDLANEIGYSTMGIIFGIDNKKLYSIEKYIARLQDAKFLNDLLNTIFKIFRNINDHFKQYLKVPIQEENYENKKITNFKFLSYFADLWTRYFSITPDNQIIDRSSSGDISYSKTIENLIFYYIMDSVKGNWGNAGDSRLNLYYLDQTRNYLNKPQKKDFEDAIAIWWQERISNPSIQFDDNSKMIMTIYYNLDKSNSGLKIGRNYDFEHLIARNKIKDIYKNLILPMGTLGNMMFLDSNINRSKKELNLYNQISSGESINKTYIDFAFYPEENLINRLENLIHIKHENLQAEVTQFVTQRGDKIIEKLIFNLYK